MIMIIAALLLETCVASFASFFLKRSSSTDQKVKILLSPFFYLGGVLYVISSGINIYLLKRLPYAVVLPLGSLTYVWTIFVSNRLLHEKITKRKILAMCVIFTGVLLLALGTPA